jgi:hypothetical protein
MMGAHPERLAEQRREGVWPRVYRLRRGQRLFLGGLGAVGIAGGLGGAVAILLEGKEPPALALIPLAFVILGAYLVAAVRVGRVVLYEDAIELVELGKGKRRLRKDEIAGLRLIRMQYGQAQLRIELRGGKKPVKAHWVHESDEVLQAWLSSIPDLDARERAQAEAELLRSSALGGTEAERVRALGRAKTTARIANGVAIAASLWGWISPRPYLAAVSTLAVLPLAALALLASGRGRYAFDARRTEPRPSLAFAVLGPGLVLGLRAILDVHVLDVAPLLAGAAIGAIVFAAALAAVAPDFRRIWAVALLTPLLAFYPWGAFSLANAVLDRAAPEVFRAAVRGKHVSTGKTTSYELRLGPWGPVTEAKTVEVARVVYDRVATGDSVCVLLRPGALGARWFVVLRCPDGARPSPPPE